MHVATELLPGVVAEVEVVDRECDDLQSLRLRKRRQLH
jgi:hypothetical protein